MFDDFERCYILSLGKYSTGVHESIDVSQSNTPFSNVEYFSPGKIEKKKHKVTAQLISFEC